MERPPVLICRSASRNFPFDVEPELRAAGYTVSSIGSLKEYVDSATRSQPQVILLEIGTTDELDRAVSLIDWTEHVQPLAPARYLLLLATKNISVTEYKVKLAAAEVLVLPQPMRNLLFKIELQGRLLRSPPPSASGAARKIEGFSARIEEAYGGDRKRVLLIRGRGPRDGAWRDSGNTPSGKVRWRWVRAPSAGADDSGFTWTAESKEAPRYDEKAAAWLLEGEDDDVVCQRNGETVYSARELPSRAATAPGEARAAAPKPAADRPAPAPPPERDVPSALAALSNLAAKAAQAPKPPAEAPASADERAGKPRIETKAPPAVEPDVGHAPPSSRATAVTSPASRGTAAGPAGDSPAEKPAREQGAKAPATAAEPKPVRAGGPVPPPNQELSRTAPPAWNVHQSGTAPLPASEISVKVTPSAPAAGASEVRLPNRGGEGTAPAGSASRREGERPAPEPTAREKAARPAAPAARPEARPKAAAEESAAAPEARRSEARPAGPAARESDPLPSLGEAVPEITAEAPAAESAQAKADVNVHLSPSLGSGPSYNVLLDSGPATPRAAPNVLSGGDARPAARECGGDAMAPDSPAAGARGAAPSPLMEAPSAAAKKASPAAEPLPAGSAKPALPTESIAGPAPAARAPEETSVTSKPTRPENDETRVGAWQEAEDDARRFLKHRHFEIMTLEQLGDQDSSWHPAGRYRIYLSARHRYYGLGRPESALPVWVYEGELAPEFLDTQKAWKFYDRLPVPVFTLQSLPVEVADALYRMCGLTPPAASPAPAPEAAKPAGPSVVIVNQPPPAQGAPAEGSDPYQPESRKKKGAWGAIVETVKKIIGK